MTWRTITASAAVALLLATASQAAAAETTVQLRLRETGHAEAGTASQGRFRVDVSARLATPGATSFGLQVGGLSFETPIAGGRFSGDVAGASGPVRVTVRVQGRSLHATVTGRVGRGSGTVLAQRCLDSASAEEFPNSTPYHGLVAASATVNGETIPLVVGWAGRSAAHDAADDARTFDVALAAAAVVPVDRPTLPVVVIAPRIEGTGWEGRVSGIAFATAEPPSLSYSVSAGSARPITDLDKTTANYGDATTVPPDETTGEPGGTFLTVPEGVVHERAFDVLVQAPLIARGVQGVAVTAKRPGGGRATATHQFTVPLPVPVQALDADFHVLEVRTLGELWVWGDNPTGALGDGTFTRPRTPEPLRAPQQVVSVGAGDRFTIVADASGAVWVWGDVDDVEDVGDPELDAEAEAATLVKVPQRVDELRDAVAVSAGVREALVLDRDGGVFLWTAARPHVSRVLGLPPMIAIADGAAGAVALDFSGDVWDLRATDDEGLPSPAAIRALPRIGAIAAGSSEMVFLDIDGVVLRRSSDGVTAFVDLPSPATSVSAGFDSSMALLDDGTVWTWSTVVAEPPAAFVAVQVRNLERVTAVVAGTGDLSFALDSGGILWKWRSFGVAAGDVRPVLAPRAFRPGRLPSSEPTPPEPEPIPDPITDPVPDPVPDPAPAAR